MPFAGPSSTPCWVWPRPVSKCCSRSNGRRSQIDKRLVLASHNRGKLRELSALLSRLSVEIVPQSAFDNGAIEETGKSFVENAILKARYAAEVSGLPAIADDSGLVVDALHGAPGIYSSRYAGVGVTDAQNVTKLLEAMKDIAEPQRSARFVCVMVLMQQPLDPCPIICEAAWEGRVLLEPRGSAGFGYDPIFYVPDHRCSAAELAPEVKNVVSHRAQAVQKLIDRLAGVVL